jgi:hypothetical protein
LRIFFVKKQEAALEFQEQNMINLESLEKNFIEIYENWKYLKQTIKQELRDSDLLPHLQDAMQKNEEELSTILTQIVELQNDHLSIDETMERLQNYLQLESNLWKKIHNMWDPNFEKVILLKLIIVLFFSFWKILNDIRMLEKEKQHTKSPFKNVFCLLKIRKGKKLNMLKNIQDIYYYI